MHLTIIPPVSEGCYFNVFYEDTLLEDRIYLFENREIASENSNWNMSGADASPYKRDHYIITRWTTNRNDSSLSGKNLLRNCDNIYTVRQFIFPYNKINNLRQI